MRIFVLLIIALAFVANADAHPGELDVEGGHFDEQEGRYHFQTQEGIYVQNPKEAPANTIVGPWVFTVIPEFSEENDGYELIDNDSLAEYTDGKLTESVVVAEGINPGVYKGHGWRIDWEIGFLKENNSTCNHNIPEIAGHLARYRGKSYFYGIIRFQSSQSVKTTIHLNYTQLARGWLNGVEFFRSAPRYYPHRVIDPENPMPYYPQSTIKEGDNILVLKIMRGGNNCGNALEWAVTCGLKPHTRTRITIPFVLEEGEVIVDYFTDDTEIHDINGDGVVNILDLVAIANAIKPAAAPRLQRQKRQKLKPWAAFKRR